MRIINLPPSSTCWSKGRFPKGSGPDSLVRGDKGTLHRARLLRELTPAVFKAERTEVFTDTAVGHDPDRLPTSTFK